MARPLFKSKEIRELFGVLFNQILTESGRGCLLIATSHIEEYLDKIILAVFPDDFSNNKRKKLLDFPGVLSSFSSKLEILYAFRYINKSLYDSLNELRKIRNEAAHSNKKEFELVKLNQQMEKVYMIGEGFLYVVKNSSMKMMVSTKVDSLKKAFKENDFPEEEIQRSVSEMFANPKVEESLKEQLPHWELIVGICCICKVLLFHRDRAIKLHKKKKVKKRVETIKTGV